MKLFTQWLISTFLFGGTLFFAAGADVLGAAEGAGDAGAETFDGSALDSSADGSDAEASLVGEDGQRSADEDLDSRDDRTDDGQRKAEQREEPELKNYRGLASARVRNLTKLNPKLAEIFKETPKIQEIFESTLRRDAAYREAFPTVAEANQFRETFPNGIADVQALQADVAETEALDKDFYTRDREGNFPGHTKIIGNMFQDDREAAVSLFRALPKEWARLDPTSYNEVMGQIVGATLAHRGIPDFIAALLDDAKAAKQDGLVNGLTKLANWADGYLREKPKPSAEEERFNRERAEFKRQSSEREREEGTRFHQSFLAESRKLQSSIIKAHPAIKRLLESKTVTDGKKAEIVEQVRKSIEQLLGKSTSFMRKLNPAYKSRNLQETINLQKAAWSQQWLLNRMVRSVLNKETPQLVSNNREAVRRRAGSPAVRQPVKTGERKDAPIGTLPAKQVSGRWYRDGGRGAPYTTAEVLSGKHLSS